jgi:hypothetical protein
MSTGFAVPANYGYATADEGVMLRLSAVEWSAQRGAAEKASLSKG